MNGSLLAALSPGQSPNRLTKSDEDQGLSPSLPTETLSMDTQCLQDICRARPHICEWPSVSCPPSKPPHPILRLYVAQDLWRQALPWCFSSFTPWYTSVSKNWGCVELVCLELPLPFPPLCKFALFVAGGVPLVTMPSIEFCMLVSHTGSSDFSKVRRAAYVVSSPQLP